MNPMQRYSRELVAAGTDAGEPRDTSLVWRGQVIKRVVVPVEASEDTPDHAASWLHRVVVERG